MSSTTQGPHSLAFRVMRLCRPSLHVDPPLLFDPSDLLLGEDIFDPSSSPSPASSDPLLSDSSPELDYRARFLLRHPTDSSGLSGLLLLPQSFGAIYLGETFCSYISINNSSNFEVREVTIKAEIQTEKQRILLLDASKSPVESIRAGGRYDFIVEHDVKELGAHTLVCTALYSDGDSERKYLPQFFKFMVANPLSVRTKVRVVKDTTYLEACIENHTKSTLYMGQVEFETAQNWSATLLKPDEHHSEISSPAGEIFKAPILIRSGGIHNYLYRMQSSSQGSGPMKVEGGNVLGKLQITWQTNLGEPGRLQTQQILGTRYAMEQTVGSKILGQGDMSSAQVNAITRHEVELRIVDIPDTIRLGRSFSVHFNLMNSTDRELGPFKVLLSENDLSDKRAVMVNGLHKKEIPAVVAYGSKEFTLNLIATKLGVQKIGGITVFDMIEKRTYEHLPDLEIFVDLD